MSIGKRIKAAREKKGLNLEALAHAVGSTRNSVWRWENDRSSPLEQISIIAIALGVSVDSLLYDAGIPTAETLEIPSIERNQQKQNLLAQVEKRQEKIGPSADKIESRECPEIAWIPVVDQHITDCDALPGEHPLIGWNILSHTPFLKKDLLDFNPKSLFAVEVAGNAMAPLLCDGETALFTLTTTIESGDIVVLAWDQEILMRGVTLNRDGSMLLHPINSHYLELDVDPKDQKLHLIGKVVRALCTRKIDKMW